MLSVPYKESPVLTSGPGLFDSGGVRRLSVDEMRARWNIRSHAILMQVNDRIRPDLLDLVADTQAYAFCYLVTPDRGKGGVIACVVSSDASSNSRVTVKLRWTDLMPPWGVR